MFIKTNVEGKEVLLSAGRISKQDLKPGLNYYEIRNSDDNELEPFSIENGVWTNYFGSLISKEPINLGSERCIYLKDEDKKRIADIVHFDDNKKELICEGIELIEKIEDWT